MYNRAWTGSCNAKQRKDSLSMMDRSIELLVQPPLNSKLLGKLKAATNFNIHIRILQPKRLCITKRFCNIHSLICNSSDCVGKLFDQSSDTRSYECGIVFTVEEIVLEKNSLKNGTIKTFFSTLKSDCQCCLQQVRGFGQHVSAGSL